MLLRTDVSQTQVNDGIPAKSWVIRVAGRWTC